MNKFFKYTLGAVALSVVATSCSNDEDPVFDKSAAERLDEAKVEYADYLTGKGGKWVMEYFSNGAEHGYAFVMEFKKSGEVVMTTNHEWSNPASTTLTESSLWEIISDNGVVLTFNSYNPLLHVFADPESYVAPGDDPENPIDRTGRGHEGDYEFTIMEKQDDGNSLKLKGKKRGHYIYMHRLDENVDPKGYIAQVVQARDNMFPAKIKRFFLTDGNTGERFVLSQSNSIFTGYPEKGDYITQSSSKSAIITPSGIRFMEPFGLSTAAVSTDSLYYEAFSVQPDGSLLCIDQNDKTSFISVGYLPEHFIYNGYKWRVNLTASDGEYASLLQAAADELKANANGSLQNYQWEMSDGKVALHMTSRIRRGSQNLTAHFYYYFEPTVDGETLNLKYTGADNNGQSYLAAMPSMTALLDKLNSTPVTFSTDNRVSALTMLLKSGDSNYVAINLQ